MNYPMPTSAENGIEKEEKTTIFSSPKENLRLEVLLKTVNLIQLNTSVAVNQNIARICI